MSIRLLLDENLSERLLHLLSDHFADSSHVRLIGLGGADDLVIWERARSEGVLLVTKDEDFLRLSVTRGFPPKVICLITEKLSEVGEDAVVVLWLSQWNSDGPRPRGACGGRCAHREWRRPPAPRAE